METLSYEKRIELGNLVPALGQFKVMEKIPQYQQCEVHNLVEAPAEVPETLRHVVFNIERGQTLHETIDFLNMCPDLKNMDIIYANELDDGAVRSGNCNVAYEIAKSIGMNYAYGLEFIELVNPDDNKGFHGNALFSRWPIRWAKVVHMPEQYNWYYDRQKRIGARVAIVCSLDIGGREVGAVSVHLENRADSEGRAAQMAVVYDEIRRSFAPDTPVMIGGDLNTNTFDGNDIPGFTALFNDPERLAKHMAAANIRRGVHLRGTSGRQRCRTFRCGGTARRGGRGRGCRFRGGRGGSFRGGGFRRSGFTRCGFRRCRLAQRFLPAEKPQNIPQHRDVQQRFHKAGPWGLTGAFRIGGRCCCHTQAKRRTQCQHTHVCLLHVSVPLF